MENLKPQQQKFKRKLKKLIKKYITDIKEISISFVETNAVIKISDDEKFILYNNLHILLEHIINKALQPNDATKAKSQITRFKPTQFGDTLKITDDFISNYFQKLLDKQEIIIQSGQNFRKLIKITKNIENLFPSIYPRSTNHENELGLIFTSKQTLTNNILQELQINNKDITKLHRRQGFNNEYFIPFKILENVDFTKSRKWTKLQEIKNFKKYISNNNIKKVQQQKVSSLSNEQTFDLLQFAIRKSDINKEIIVLLIGKTELNKKQKSELFALACGHTSLDIIKYLYEHLNPDVTLIHKFGTCYFYFLRRFRFRLRGSSVELSELSEIAKYLLPKLESSKDIKDIKDRSLGDYLNEYNIEEKYNKFVRTLSLQGNFEINSQKTEEKTQQEESNFTKLKRKHENIQKDTEWHRVLDLSHQEYTTNDITRKYNELKSLFDPSKHQDNETEARVLVNIIKKAYTQATNEMKQQTKLKKFLLVLINTINPTKKEIPISFSSINIQIGGHKYDTSDHILTTSENEHFFSLLEYIINKVLPNKANYAKKEIDKIKQQRNVRPIITFSGINYDIIFIPKKFSNEVLQKLVLVENDAKINMFSQEFGYLIKLSKIINKSSSIDTTTPKIHENELGLFFSLSKRPELLNNIAQKLKIQVSNIKKIETTFGTNYFIPFALLRDAFLKEQRKQDEKQTQSKEDKGRKADEAQQEALGVKQQEEVLITTEQPEEQIKKTKKEQAITRVEPPKLITENTTNEYKIRDNTFFVKKMESFNGCHIMPQNPKTIEYTKIIEYVHYRDIQKEDSKVIASGIVYSDKKDSKCLDQAQSIIKNSNIHSLVKLSHHPILGRPGKSFIDKLKLKLKEQINQIANKLKPPMSQEKISFGLVLYSPYNQQLLIISHNTHINFVQPIKATKDTIFQKVNNHYFVHLKPGTQYNIFILNGRRIHDYEMYSTLLNGNCKTFLSENKALQNQVTSSSNSVLVLNPQVVPTYPEKINTRKESILAELNRISNINIEGPCVYETLRPPIKYYNQYVTVHAARQDTFEKIPIQNIIQLALNHDKSRPVYESFLLKDEHYPGITSLKSGKIVIIHDTEHEKRYFFVRLNTKDTQQETIEFNGFIQLKTPKNDPKNDPKNKPIEKIILSFPDIRQTIKIDFGELYQETLQTCKQVSTHITTHQIKDTPTQTFENTPKKPTKFTSKKDIINNIGNYQPTHEDVEIVTKFAGTTQPTQFISTFYKDIQPKSTTNDRKKFVETLFDILEKDRDTNDTNLKDSNQGIITMKQLLGPNGVNQYVNALNEEMLDKRYRNAVLANAIYTVSNNKQFNKKMVLWIGGPSASGKTFAAKRVIDSLFTGLDPKYFTDNQSDDLIHFLFIDGGIERKVSQMRQLVLQTALAKGYRGIEDLEDFWTKKKIKTLLRKIAKEIPIFNIVIPSTFAPTSLLRIFDPYELIRYYSQQDIYHFFSQIVATPGKETQFQLTVAHMGNSRAFKPATQPPSTPSIAIELNNLDIGVESKKYLPKGFASGVRQSNSAKDAYIRSMVNNKQDPVYIIITNDLIRTYQDIQSTYPKQLRSCGNTICPPQKNIIIISESLFKQWNNLYTKPDNIIQWRDSQGKILFTEICQGQEAVKQCKPPIPLIPEKHPTSLQFSSQYIDKQKNKLIDDYKTLTNAYVNIMKGKAFIENPNYKHTTDNIDNIDNILAATNEPKKDAIENIGRAIANSLKKDDKKLKLTKEQKENALHAIRNKRYAIALGILTGLTAAGIAAFIDAYFDLNYMQAFGNWFNNLIATTNEYQTLTENYHTQMSNVVQSGLNFAKDNTTIPDDWTNQMTNTVMTQLENAPPTKLAEMFTQTAKAFDGIKTIFKTVLNVMVTEQKIPNIPAIQSGESISHALTETMQTQLASLTQLGSKLSIDEIKRLLPKAIQNLEQGFDIKNITLDSILSVKGHSISVRDVFSGLFDNKKQYIGNEVLQYLSQNAVNARNAAECLSDPLRGTFQTCSDIVKQTIKTQIEGAVDLNSNYWLSGLATILKTQTAYVGGSIILLTALAPAGEMTATAVSLIAGLL